MSQEQFDRIRYLIKSKQYDEARILLRKLDSLDALLWLEKLEKIAPESPAKDNKPSAPIADVPEKFRFSPQKRLSKPETGTVSKPPFSVYAGGLAALMIGVLVRLIVLMLARNPGALQAAGLPTQVMLTQTSVAAASVGTPPPTTTPFVRATLPPTFTPTPVEPLLSTATLFVRATLPPTFTPTPVSVQPTALSGDFATAAAYASSVSIQGSGTGSDPFRFDMQEGYSSGVVNEALMQVSPIFRHADYVAASGNIDIHKMDAPAGQQYIFATLAAICLRASDKTCEYSMSDFQLVGSKGHVYDADLSATWMVLPFEGKVYGGQPLPGTLAFIIDKSDTDFLLIYKPNVSTDEAYFFQAPG